MSARVARSSRARRAAQHRPAVRQRRFRHDNLTALDLFSGFGGMTEGARRAGFAVIMAANHNEYKVLVHEANHPYAEHWRADLVDTESADYHSVRDLPKADLLIAGVSCKNHSLSNSQRAYQQGASLFDLHDPDYEDQVTRSERDRATANCVLHYAAEHHPRLILVECTTQLQSWGKLVPGSRKIGDGSTYRWWLKQFEIEGYRHKVLFLNSMFFGVGQSRDRAYWVFWDEKLPAPDLDHRPPSWCSRCDTVVEAFQAWRTGIPQSGTVQYGKQYCYRCPSCRGTVIPPFTPSLDALDLSDLGTRIGDMPLKTIKDKKTGEVYQAPLARATMERAERCRQKFGEFPAVLMPAKAVHGTEKHPWQPMATQTSQQETAILSTGALMAAAGNTYERAGSDCRTRDFSDPLPTQTATNGMGMLTPPSSVAVSGQVLAAHRHNGDGKHIALPMDTVTATHEKAILLAVDNFQGAPRSAGEPLPTQAGSETMGVLSAGIVPYRQHTAPVSHAEAMPTVTAEQIPGVITAAGFMQQNEGVDRRVFPVGDPLRTVTATGNHHAVLFSGWYKQNGSTGVETAPHPLSDPLGTLTSRDTTALLNAEWWAGLAEVQLEDCYFRMMATREIGRGCGFDVDWNGRKGSFIVWGAARDQVDGFGNAVTPAVSEWICGRLRAVLHGEVFAA